MREICVEKNDVLPLLHFIVLKFQQEKIHRQGTSSKDDYLGGFIDRWINKIPETLLLNKLLLEGLKFEIIPDYFVYNSSTQKNAPDILGIKANEVVIKFAGFNNNKWELVEGMPYIEVKTFKSNQSLVSVRDTQLEADKYYVFAESDLKNDYLLSFFNDEIFREGIREKIQMDDSFIINNDNESIMNAPEIRVPYDNIIGTIRLICVINGADFISKTVKCDSGENVFYVKSIEERVRVTGKKIDISFNDFFNYDESTNTGNFVWNGRKLIPISCVNSKNIQVLKANKGNMLIKTNGECEIYGEKLSSSKVYSLEIVEFERSSAWTEYVGHKYQFNGLPDRANELIQLLKKIHEDSKLKICESDSNSS